MEKDNRKRKCSDLREAMFFALRDLKYQKKRTFFIVVLFLTMAGLSALFIGELFVYKDDRITRKYDTSAFLQKTTEGCRCAGWMAPGLQRRIANRLKR